MSYLTTAGPFVWPILLLSLAGVVMAVLHLLRHHDRKCLSLALGLTASAVLAAALSTVAGFQKSIAALGQLADDQRWIYLIGVGESLNGMVIALVAALVVSLVLAYGTMRRDAEGAV